MDSALQDRYHKLLGAYIATTTNVETHLDNVIGGFFNVNASLYMPFQWWVLGRIDFSLKLEILGQLLEMLNEKDKYSALRKGLRDMMETRNKLAHGYYQQVSDVDATGNKKPPKLARTHRKSKPKHGQQFEALDLDELEKKRDALAPVVKSLMDLKHRCMRLWPHRIHKVGSPAKDEPGDFAKTVREWPHIW